VPIPEGLRATPFSPRYADGVGEWTDVYGHAVPLFLDDPAMEYSAIRRAAGAAEYSMLYKWHVEGPAAVAAVDAVVSRNVRALRPGRLAYGVVVDDDGMMLDDVTVAVPDPRHVIVTGGNPAILEHIVAHAPAGTTATERRDESAVLSLQGPRSREILQRLTGADVSNTAFPYYTFRTGLYLAGIPAQASRVGFTAELGYELQVPRGHALKLWDAVFQAGADLGLRAFGAAALMMCRTEAGMIMGELEYDRTVTPFECRMGWAVDFTKGPFLGREALLTKKETAVGRMVSVVVDAAPETAEGARLRLGRRDVGYIPTAVSSPHLDGATLGLARVHRDGATIGTVLTAMAADGRRVAARVSPTPAYDPTRTRVRA
jgi:aminomethyltransferase